MSKPVHAMLQVPRIPQDVFEEERWIFAEVYERV
jgi:hypothetical protein